MSKLCKQVSKFQFQVMNPNIFSNYFLSRKQNKNRRAKKQTHKLIWILSNLTFNITLLDQCQLKKNHLTANIGKFDLTNQLHVL